MIFLKIIIVFFIYFFPSLNSRGFFCLFRKYEHFYFCLFIKHTEKNAFWIRYENARRVFSGRVLLFLSCVEAAEREVGVDVV